MALMIGTLTLQEDAKLYLGAPTHQVRPWQSKRILNFLLNEFRPLQVWVILELPRKPLNFLRLEIRCARPVAPLVLDLA
jgi:hypothetical protein